MFRSLHMKLVLIMVLLIVSLMTVVGAFLTNSVSQFYMEDFYAQMEMVFSDVEFARDLVTPAEDEEDGAAALQQVMQSYRGTLGIDARNRNYYILDDTGNFLTGSDPESGATLNVTHNLTAALNGEEGSTGDPAASYMDVAVPITRGDRSYVIYILDNRSTVEDLSSELFTLILEALVFGLVISVLLSFLLAKTMITPIEHLTDAAEQVADGNFSSKIEVTARDEIGILTSAFNDMAQQLKDTLDAVENERTKLSTLFLHMTDGVVAFSRDGQLIHSNPAAERMLQTKLDSDTQYGPLFGDIAPLAQVLSAPSGGYIEGERGVRGRTLALLLAPFSGESQEGGALVVLRDVTEQHKVEEQRKEFVANVSHELRTPLTNIRSYAETLADNAGDLPPEMQRNFLGVILNESDRMTHIVQDLLTLSRFDSGRSELKLTQFSFDRALRDLYHAVLLEAQRHQHEIILDIPDGLPEIRADRERILQVMMNVVSNAIKYTPDGGRIAISAGQAGSRVWMEVEDNGIGIPPEDRERIFERFYRVDKARSRQSGGTGLGLSIATEIMNRHEGSLSLVERDGPGTTVRMELNVEGPSHEE